MLEIVRKIVKYFNFNRIYNNLKFLYKYDLESFIYSIKDETIEDIAYEYEENKKILSNLTIKSEFETLEILNKNPKSFSRFGDAEIKIMQGINVGYQKYNKELAEKLYKVLKNNRNDIYVGLNKSYFESPIKYSLENRKFYRTNGTKLRRFLINNCSVDSIYYNACCFGGYFRQNDEYDFESLYSKIKELFYNKKIALICGEGILNEIEYNILDVAKELIVIEAPRKNAYDEYTKIIDNITKKITKDYLICIVLGTTATVMVADLTDLGYMAWDIGHCILDYNAYKTKQERTSENYQKYLS